MLNEKYFELMADYLEGNLDSSEKAKLENEMEANPEMRELMELLKISTESIKLSGQIKLISSIHANYKKQETILKAKPKTYKIKPWWLGIAATFILLISFGRIWLNITPENFHKEIYIPYNLPILRSGENNPEDINYYFKNEDFESVVAFVNLESENRQDLFLAGIANMELNNPIMAIQFFKKVQELNLIIPENQKLYQDESDFYLFILFTEIEDFSMSDIYFERIKMNKNHLFHQNLDFKTKLKYSILKIK